VAEEDMRGFFYAIAEDSKTITRQQGNKPRRKRK